MSAAASALISFFASNDDFLDHKSRVDFAIEMKQHYRFLFQDSLAEDHMVSCFTHHPFVYAKRYIGLEWHVERPHIFASLCITLQRNSRSLCSHSGAGLRGSRPRGRYGACCCCGM